MIRRYVLALASVACLAVPSLALATARLINVVPTDGGCVAGPSGPTVEAWDVEPGKTYQITISNVSECGNGGTAATINVRVNSTGSGNTDLVATFVSPGVYTFSYTVPVGATCTMPIFYCTTPGNNATGIFVIRNDGGPFQAHLRAATFGSGCSNPTPLIGPDCGAVPVRPRSWGQVKAYYHN